MESCESLYYKSKATQQDLKDTHLDKQTEGDTKLALQIFGGKKDIILKSVPLFEERGNYDFLDFKPRFILKTTYLTLFTPEASKIHPPDHLPLKRNAPPKQAVHLPNSVSIKKECLFQPGIVFLIG